MTPEQFCYWLQGFAEIKGGWEEPTAQEWAVIKDHLQLVFKKETPKYGLPSPMYPPVPTDRVFPPPPWPKGPLITC